jgi:hypothetical protein
MFHPLIFKLNSNKIDDFDKDKNPIILNDFINLPAMSLGFHTFINRTKNSMNITKNIEVGNNMQSINNIVEPFNYVIPDYKESLESLTSTFLNIKINNMTRDFYISWEILSFFDLVDFKTLNCLCFSENAESILLSITKYREKNKLNNKKDNYKEVNEINNYLNISKKISKSEDYVSLLYLDSPYKWTNSDSQEGESYPTIIREIFGLLLVLNKNGNLIIKIYESFTKLSVKLIYIITSFFEESYIYKPFFSTASTTDRYLICKNFKLDQKKDKKKLNNIIELFSDIESKLTNKLYVEDIFSSMEISSKYYNMFRFINIKISNIQQITINEIIKYIKGNNYYGKEYHAYRDNQITSTKWWYSTFFKIEDELTKLLTQTLKKNDMEYNIFIENII